MLRLYYASAIDTCVKEAFEQIEMFKKIFAKFSNIEIYGAGFGISPVISLNSSKIFKKATVAHDLRQLRLCDIFLMVTDLKKYGAGSHMELEYARRMGLLTIILVLNREIICEACNGSGEDEVYGTKNCCSFCKGKGKLLRKEKVKNIFLETLADKIIYSIEELEEILKEITK